MANVFLCTSLAANFGSSFGAYFGFLALGSAADLRRAGIFVICMILAIGVHEFAHALAAHRLGDPTPEGQGRLTLNPVAHMDPIGTLALPLILGITGTGMIFGWGRPVQTTPRYYTRKVTMRAGMALVAFAGPLSNLLQAVITLGLVLALTRTLFGARHPRVAEDLMNLGATEQERGNYTVSESLFRQALGELSKTAPFHPTKQRRVRHAHVLKEKLGCVARPLANFVERWAALEARQALGLNQEKADAGFSLRSEDNDVGGGAIGDKCFGATDNVAIGISLCAGGHGAQIAAAAGLSHGDGANQLARDHFGQDSLFLIL